MTNAAAAGPPEMRVVSTIRALKASRRVSTETIARQLQLSRSTWFERMRTGQFTIGEVITLADLFGVSVQSIVDGQVTLAKVRPVLVAAPSIGHGLSGSAPRRSTLGTQSPLMHSLPTLA